MHRLRVTDPVVQGKLEESDSTHELVKRLEILPQNNMTPEEYTLMKRNYLVFLIAQYNFDQYIETTHGIKRKKHIEGLKANLKPSALSADSASLSGLLSTSLTTPSLSSTPTSLTSMPGLSISGPSTTDTIDSKKKPKAK
ncbi:unnamed protein product [Saimiriine gammaherpesvirus 2]|uniref:Small capsomere-interacting protein n=1 Tax=Saimiriine herpesvirus 2 (strain 11) TaxID=10383 RepID=SCP_SHV21|nr:unnamed protein product [Saimiriine gammaherpesvirus 2]Q01047.1 RecName: Full=Small capsomere-interacting protein [Herpesvirus saimiri (strain 11)]pir/I36812/ hypothetical protein ORF65 - saimiriine herpesvirus 1 (strain 11) [Saimiriine alphaherpesvirus 1]AAA46141.1 first methionine codon in the ECLF7 ORF [Saimiriine gammaherpesvirus 2]CAA45688.1 unnamed protein product [Saimiriine gammaherpesvirus 2]